MQLAPARLLNPDSGEVHVCQRTSHATGVISTYLKMQQEGRNNRTIGYTFNRQSTFQKIKLTIQRTELR